MGFSGYKRTCAIAFPKELHVNNAMLIVNTMHERKLGQKDRMDYRQNTM